MAQWLQGVACWVQANGLALSDRSQATTVSVEFYP